MGRNSEANQQNLLRDRHELHRVHLLLFLWPCSLFELHPNSIVRDLGQPTICPACAMNQPSVQYPSRYGKDVESHWALPV